MRLPAPWKRERTPRQPSRPAVYNCDVLPTCAMRSSSSSMYALSVAAAASWSPRSSADIAAPRRASARSGCSRGSTPRSVRTWPRAEGGFRFNFKS